MGRALLSSAFVVVVLALEMCSLNYNKSPIIRHLHMKIAKSLGEQNR